MIELPKIEYQSIMRTCLLVIIIPFAFISCNNLSNRTDSGNVRTDLVSESLSKNDRSSDTLTLDSASLAMKQKMDQPVTKHILTKDDLYRDYDGGSELSNFFEIELIDREMYLSNRNSSINYLLYDSAAFVKKDGVLKLPLEKGELLLKDNLTNDDKHKEYRYIGQFKALDMYLVQGVFWEDWACILFDKKRDRQVQSFMGIPYLSTDMQYIVCLELDSVEGVGSISLYAVTENEKTKKKYIDPIVEMYIKSWVPYTSTDNIYWSTDGYLYAPVMYAPNFWDAQDHFYGLDQYIRLRPVA